MLSPKKVKYRKIQKGRVSGADSRGLELAFGDFGLKSIETKCAKQLCEAAVTTDEVFQTEIVLLAWRVGVRIKEIPVSIREMRATPVSILKRGPKVWDTIGELKRSLRRVPSKSEAEPGPIEVRLPHTKVKAQSERPEVV